MAFEVYQKGSSASRKSPVVTIQKSGAISINDAGYAQLGEPHFVQLLHDADERLIALKPTSETDLNGYAARRSNASKGTGPVVISAGNFAADCGVDTSHARRWTPDMVDGMLVVDLKVGGVIVISNRERGRLARERSGEIR